MPQHKVAIFPRHPTSWAWLFEVARLLRDQSDLAPVMLLVTPEVAGYAAQCKDANIQFLNVSSARQQAIASHLGMIGRAVDRCDGFFAKHHRIANCFPVSLFRFIAMRRKLRAELNVYRAVLSKLSPIALLTPGDREMSPVPAMLRAAKDLAVPIVNYSFGSPYPQGLALQREGQSQFSTQWREFPPLVNFVVKNKFPRQLLDQQMLFSPGWLILAHWSLGMLSDNPWVQGGGLSDYLFQNSVQRRESYLASGVSEHKLVFTGDPSLDSLHAAYENRDAIRARLGVSAGPKVIMFSLPNDYEHGLCDLQSHRTRMRDYLSILSKCEAKTFVSLHPKAKADDYRDLMSEYKLTLLPERLAGVLPAADVFVASGSSTIPWAQLCGIPVINLDYLGIREPEVEAADTVETPAGFERLLHNILASRGKPVSDDAVRSENLFDGQSGKRIIRFLSSLADNPFPGAAARQA